MKKFILSVTYLILIIGALCLSGYVLRPKDSDVCINQISDFGVVKKNSLDAIVYGSSHAWLGFDAKEFEDKTGLKSYNYSCFWQSFNTTWLFFHDSLRRQKPEVVFIEAGRVNSLIKDTGLEGQTYYTRKLSLSKEKLQYMHQCFGNSLENNISYILPIVTFHTKWEDNAELFKGRDKRHFIETAGLNSTNSTREFESALIGASVGKDLELTKQVEELNEYEGGEIGEQEINELSISLMKDITETCKNNNIRLIWFVAPYVGDYNYDKAMKEFVGEYGGEYVNLFDHLNDMGFDSKTDMSDADHLNASGAFKVADYMAEYIK